MDESIGGSGTPPGDITAVPRRRVRNILADPANNTVALRAVVEAEDKLNKYGLLVKRQVQVVWS